MKVTKIETQKRNKEKVNIYVDNKYLFSLTLNGLLASHLKEGSEITDSQIEELKIEDEPKLAFQHALNIISYSMKTEFELVKKLREKEFSEPAIEQAVQKLKGYKYIDDDIYVTMYIKTKAIPNNWGEQKIISKLLQKGVDINLIKQKIEELYSYDEKKNAITKVAEKYVEKLPIDEDILKKKQKLYRYLAGKGYSYELISSTVSSILGNNEE